MDLTIKTEGNTEYRITGNARFFVVRGDSALIPQELSFRPDSNRWYIDQWRDETLQGVGGTLLARSAARAWGAGSLRAPQDATVPSAFDMSWGKLNALYVR